MTNGHMDGRMNRDKQPERQRTYFEIARQKIENKTEDYGR